MMVQERVVFITGAGSGIGAAIAATFAKHGYLVVVTDIDLASATKTAQEIINAGYLAHALALDVGQSESIASCFAYIVQQFARCDVLVNNAGIATATSLETCSVDEWSRTMQVNVTSAMLCSQHASRLMRNKRWGRIINISSISGICASSERLAYGTSKAALIGLTKQIAVEMAPFGITANAIAPGAIETPLTLKFHTQAIRDDFQRRIPSGQYGQVSDVAAAALYLASDEAHYVNGHVLAIDGGFLAAGIMTTTPQHNKLG